MTSKQKDLLAYVTNPKNIAKAAKGSMEKRQAVMDAAAREEELPPILQDFAIVLQAKNIEPTVELLDWLGGVADHYEQVLSQQYEREKAELEKAYGGCHNCYGKGYSTEESAVIGYPDFIGDEGFKRYEHRMNFCDCDRGRQLKAELQHQSNGGESK